MAPDRNNASSREQIMNKHEEEEDEMNDADAGAGAVVDSSNSRRDGMLCTLLRLKVVRGPLFVLRKKLVRSYLSRNQNYLGITQNEYAGGFRRNGVLTDEEDARARATGGLPLRALDRRGVTYPMVLVSLTKTCRLRTGWGDFLRGSGVRQDDDTHVGDVVEIWAFRSPEWPPNGLGLVLLHYTKEEDDAIITASSSLIQQQEDELEEEDGSDQDDVVDDKNCSPPDKEVVHAADILNSISKIKRGL